MSENNFTLLEIAFVIKAQVTYCTRLGFLDPDPEDPKILRVDRLLLLEEQWQGELHRWLKRGSRVARQQWDAIYGPDWEPFLIGSMDYLKLAIHDHWWQILDHGDPQGEHHASIQALLLSRDRVSKKLSEIRDSRREAFFETCREMAPRLISAAD